MSKGRILVTSISCNQSQKNEILFYHYNNHILFSYSNQLKMSNVVLCQPTNAVKSDVSQSQIVMGWIVKCPRCKKLHSNCKCK